MCNTKQRQNARKLRNGTFCEKSENTEFLSLCSDSTCIIALCISIPVHFITIHAKHFQNTKTSKNVFE